MEITKQDILDTIAQKALAEPALREVVKEILLDTCMLDAKRAARLLGYHPNHLRRLPIDHVQEGRRDRRYSLRSIQAWREKKLVKYRK